MAGANWNSGTLHLTPDVNGPMTAVTVSGASSSTERTATAARFPSIPSWSRCSRSTWRNSGQRQTGVCSPGSGAPSCRPSPTAGPGPPRVRPCSRRRNRNHRWPGVRTTFGTPASRHGSTAGCTPLKSPNGQATALTFFSGSTPSASTDSTRSPSAGLPRRYATTSRPTPWRPTRTPGPPMAAPADFGRVFSTPSRIRAPSAAQSRIALSGQERPNPYVTAGQDTLRWLVAGWGGWGSNPRPADYEKYGPTL
jgi:hypothetical protein